ncbi:MAG: serine hydrolase domain-containing protein [Pseudomonadota bacterium]
MTRLLCALAFAISCLFPAAAQDSNLADMLKETREQAGLVGAGAAVMVNGEVVAIATDGERIKDSGEAISPDAVWHVGSISKSMTATLIAALVEDGALTFETTIGDIYGSKAHESWRDITLNQLLTHRAGAPANFSRLATLAPDAKGQWAVSNQRQERVEAMVATEKSREPGTFLYSNVGYTIAGAMAEKAASGTPWEILIYDWVFKPIGANPTFGPPRGDTAPWGHTKGLFGKAAKDPTKRADNPQFIGPAGTIALSLTDLLKFGQAHLAQDEALLSGASFDRLISPPVREEESGRGYAYGWVVDPSGGSVGAGPMFWHNGSNTMWYALLIIVPEQNMVMAFTSNDGDVQAAERAFIALARDVAQDFGQTP